MPAREPPWFKFYHRDYQLGTATLTPEARGIYHELLMVQFQQRGRLPKDVRKLRELSRHSLWSLQRFRRFWNELVETGKFKEDDRGFYNERMELTVAEAVGTTVGLSKRGRLGGRAKWGCRRCREDGKPMKPGSMTGAETKCPICGRYPWGDD